MDPLNGLVAVSLGLGLAAASGFRVFLPPMLLSGAMNFGLMDPSGNLAMLDGWGAFSLLLIAVVLEIGSYLIPWIDNLLDVVASPAAVVAGIALMGTVLGFILMLGSSNLGSIDPSDVEGMKNVIGHLASGM